MKSLKNTIFFFLLTKNLRTPFFTVITLFSITTQLRAQSNVYYGTYSDIIKGKYNAAFGATVLFKNTGMSNTGVGYEALYSNTIGDDNTAVGFRALSNNTGGGSNTAVGSDALQFNTGYSNTAIGRNALWLNKEGRENTAVGVAALAGNMAGDKNTALGMYALNNNNSGYSNTATGYKSLFKSIGNYNTANGFEALYSNTASNNTAMGMHALYYNTTGTGNTATGANALTSNTTADFNTATGYAALANDTTGQKNEANGYGALYSNSKGNDNAANGYKALFYNTEGNSNTGSGFAALFLNTTGSGNTSIGRGALYSNTTGSNNTAIGLDADVTSGGFDNATAIGSQAKVNASNKAVIGNTSVTVIGGSVNWSNLSDARFKKNIEENVHGLDFIMQLKPVTYNMDVRKLNQFLGVDKRTSNDDRISPEEQAKLDRINEESIAKKESIRYTGFVAQQVEEAAKAVNYNFSGVIKPANDKDHYSISYSEFVVPLVKGMQEQQQKIEKLEQTVEELKKIIATLTSNSSTNNKTTAVELSDKNTIVLNQNTPNPFAEKTTISYDIPQTAGTGQMMFYNANGQLVKSVNLSKGKGQLNIYSADLKSGPYSYTLIVDGKIVDTRKMIKQ